MKKIIYLFIFTIIYTLTSCNSVKKIQKSNPLLKKRLEQLIENDSTDIFLQVFKKNKFSLKNNIDKDGTTLLFLAATKGNTTIGEFLIKNGANVNIVSKYGTAMHWALEKRKSDFARLLLNHGYNPKIEAQILNNKAPLNFLSFFLIKKDKEVGMRILTTLLKKGMNPNIQDKDGASIIHVATYYGFTNVITLLREYNANLNLRILPNDGEAKRDAFIANHPTPLMMAVYFDKKDIVKELLLFSNLKINAKGIVDGKTALDIAKDKNYIDIINLLTQASN